MVGIETYLDLYACFLEKPFVCCFKHLHAKGSIEMAKAVPPCGNPCILPSHELENRQALRTVIGPSCSTGVRTHGLRFKQTSTAASSLSRRLLHHESHRACGMLLYTAQTQAPHDSFRLLRPVNPDFHCLLTNHLFLAALSSGRWLGDCPNQR